MTGNPLAGITEKVCIQAEKIFDAGIKQTQLTGYTLTLENIQPATVTYPLTFVSGRSLSADATVTNLTIDRQADKNCARVQATVSAPIEVLFTDANGVEGTATATVTLPQDVLLHVPAPSIMPYSILAVVSIVAPDATWDATSETFTANLCVTVILKVSMSVEILVPSYGYCAIPPVQDYSQEVCAGFFELPLYPRAKPCGGGGKC